MILHQNIPEEMYLSILERMPICCVDVVVTHLSRILLVLRKECGRWWLPGGRVCKNETLYEAAYRKVLEEVGIKTRIVKQFGVYEWVPAVNGKLQGKLYSNIDSGLHVITTGFLVTPVEDIDVQLDETSMDYKWVDAIESSWHPMLVDIISDSGAINA